MLCTAVVCTEEASLQINVCVCVYDVICVCIRIIIAYVCVRVWLVYATSTTGQSYTHALSPAVTGVGTGQADPADAGPII